MLPLICLLSALGPNPVSLRTSTPLDKGWQWVIQRPGTETMPKQGWANVVIPKNEFIDGKGEKANVWFRTQIQKAVKPGQRAVIVVRAALYAPTVFVDGRAVESWLNGWTPHEVDVTRYFSDGRSHELAILCHDRTVTNDGGFVPPKNSGEDALRGKVIFPIGGYKDMTGILRPVELRVEPATHLVTDDLSIVTSVRKGTLSVSGVASGGNKVRLIVTTADGDRGLVREGAIDSEGHWSCVEAMKEPKLWSPEHPYLYGLTVQLLDKGGRVVDSFDRRFGFREIWTSGPDFVLNGIKRHLLATSTWPVTEFLDRDTIRQRIRAVKRSGDNAFRLHIGPWQEEVAEIADEEGLMIVDEAPVYTDGAGFYAYQNPVFWQNYRDVVTGIIRRDRNHPSVVMWSLGNEILFMGNLKYDADLPKKQGELSRYVKKLDPTRPTTYEADLDPDGAFDVIGLHYPHELPYQYAYPVITDWLGTGKETDAAGGMLGTTSNEFVWKRDKPLYIGEYLWVPMGDYSPGTIFFGEQAYENRSLMNDRAKAAAWIDQTLAYRRAGVSGLSPWTAFGFGMAPDKGPLLDAQKEFYKTEAAYLRNKALRTYSGGRLTLTFDLYNETETKNTYRLTVTGTPGATAVLEPAEHRVVSLLVSAPAVKKETKIPLEITLRSGSAVVDRSVASMVVSPHQPLVAPSGWQVLRVDSLSQLAELNELKTILVIAPHLLEASTVASELPVVGRKAADVGALTRFLRRGGRAVILEQENFGNLPLPVTLADHLSTMAFSSDYGMPDLRFWGKDMVVAKRQILRDGRGGVRSLAVSGGPDSLAHAPLAVIPVGQGSVVSIQMLAGEKMAEEPAAASLLQRAVDLLAAEPVGQAGKVLVWGADAAANKLVDEIGLDATKVSDGFSVSEAKAAAGIVIVGNPKGLALSSQSIRAAKAANVPIVWVGANASQFEQLKESIDLSGMQAIESKSTPISHDLSGAMGRGLTAEEFTWTTSPSGWDHSIQYRINNAPFSFVPNLNTPTKIGASLKGAKLLTSSKFTLAQRSTVSVKVRVPADGWYPVTIVAHREGGAEIELFVDDETRGRISVVNQPVRTWVRLPRGESQLGLFYANGPSWASGTPLVIDRLEIGEGIGATSDLQILADPWVMVASSRVVVSSMVLGQDPDNQVKSRRILSALCANLGMPFASPDAPSGDSIPLRSFKIESGPYNEVSDSAITLRSNGSAAGGFLVDQAGGYRLIVDAQSTVTDGGYANIAVEIDDKVVGEIQCSQAQLKSYEVTVPKLKPGKHQLRLSFTNDASNGTEDRNLEIRRVAFSLGG